MCIFFDEIYIEVNSDASVLGGGFSPAASARSIARGAPASLSDSDEPRLEAEICREEKAGICSREEKVFDIGRGNK